MGSKMIGSWSLQKEEVGPPFKFKKELVIQPGPSAFRGGRGQQ